jgi:hypothetical protein
MESLGYTRGGKGGQLTITVDQQGSHNSLVGEGAGQDDADHDQGEGEDDPQKGLGQEGTEGFHHLGVCLTGALRCRFEPTQTYGGHHCLQTRADMHFGENAGEVGLHRSFADHKGIGDGSIVEASGKHL